jgi:hypothetical protein
MILLPVVPKTQLVIDYWYDTDKLVLLRTAKRVFFLYID